MIEITDKDLEGFTKAYEKAVKADLDQFKFHGEFVLTTYAKYVIMYMQPDYEPTLFTGNK